jgi:hypothetical protein
MALRRSCWRHGMVLGSVLLLLVSCQTVSQPSPVPTAPLPTSLPGRLQRPTLPPTWTPTPTHTPAPPSPTPSETPIPTSRPTPSAADICAELWVVSNFDSPSGSGDALVFRPGNNLSLIASIDSPTDSIRFSFVERRSGEGQGLDIPGGQIGIVGWEINELPRQGLYDWSLVVISPTYGELCQKAGSFWVIRPGHDQQRSR